MPILCNQSRLGEDEKCPRRYAYKYLFNLEPKEPSLAMFSGSVVHAALAAHYKGLAIDEVLRVYDARWAGFEATDLTRERAKEMEPLWRKRVEQYPQQYPQENFEVMLVPEAELEVPVGDDCVLMMRLDMIIRRKDNGSVWVVDHKTASKTGASYWPRYFVDLQGSAYVYGAQKVLGEEVAGWIINALKSTKEGWYERQAFPRTRRQLESFENQMSKRIRRLNERHIMTPRPLDLDDPECMSYLDEHFPQYTHECHGFGTCAYLGLCHTGRAALPLYVPREVDYVDRSR